MKALLVEEFQSFCESLQALVDLADDEKLCDVAKQAKRLLYTLFDL